VLHSRQTALTAEQHGKISMYDVIEIQTAAPHSVRVLAINKDQKNAEAIVALSIIRRGLDGKFYSIETAGKYKDGDAWLSAHFAGLAS
jgi:hypothetical protein